jgi:hypothetical protein
LDTIDRIGYCCRRRCGASKPNLAVFEIDTEPCARWLVLDEEVLLAQRITFVTVKIASPIRARRYLNRNALDRELAPVGFTGRCSFNDLHDGWNLAVAFVVGAHGFPVLVTAAYGAQQHSPC